MPTGIRTRTHASAARTGGHGAQKTGSFRPGRRPKMAEIDAHLFREGLVEAVLRKDLVIQQLLAREPVRRVEVEAGLQERH